MPTAFQTLEADHTAVVTSIDAAVASLDKVTERTDAEKALKTLEDALAKLNTLESVRNKQYAKASQPKEKRLINDATATAILAFCSKFDATLDDLKSRHLPRAKSLLDSMPPPAPEPKPEPVVPVEAAPVTAPPPTAQPGAAAASTPPAEDPELAAALAMSMSQDTESTTSTGSGGGGPAGVPTPTKSSTPSTSPVKVVATPRQTGPAKGATSVCVRLIKTGLEMDIAVPEGTDVMTVGEFRQLVAAVYGIEAVHTAMLIVSGKQLRDEQTLTAGGVTGTSKVFVGIDPKARAPSSSLPTVASTGAVHSATTTTQPAASAPPGGGGGAAPAAGPPQDPSKAAVIAAMVAAITTMKAATDYTSLVAAVRTVVKLLGNLVKHPDDPKYTKVKTGNVLLKTRLLSKPGGYACLEAVGFKKDQTGNFLICDTPHEHTGAVKDMLDEALARWEQT
eukprot:m.173748 g.173748  ORF g.173748 m.173748 type:complete len:450 (+) comp13736_c0_seq1:92-1441(+)